MLAGRADGDDTKVVLSRQSSVVAALLTLALFGGVRLQADQDSPAFDVVSIKPADSGARGTPPIRLAQTVSFCTFNAGRFRCAGDTPLTLLRIAFQTDGVLFPPSQFIGLPDWATTKQFTIAATVASGDTVTTAQIGPVVRRMLEDRFQLKARVEQRPFPAYALVVARPDGRLGPKLKPSTADCFPTPPDFPALPAGVPRCFSGVSRAGAISAPNYTMSELVRRLTQYGGAERIVVDRTGLSGKWEVDLHWSADVSQPSDDPPLVTAIQEQLGLKLEPRTEQLPAVVIERIEPPSPN